MHEKGPAEGMPGLCGKRRARQGEGGKDAHVTNRFVESLRFVRNGAYADFVAIAAGEHAAVVALRAPFGRILLNVFGMHLVAIDAGGLVRIMLFVAVVLMRVDLVAVGVGQIHLALGLGRHFLHGAVALGSLTALLVDGDLAGLQVRGLLHVAVLQSIVRLGERILGRVALDALQIGMLGSLGALLIGHRRSFLAMAGFAIAFHAPFDGLRHQRIDLLLAGGRVRLLRRASHDAAQSKRKSAYGADNGQEGNALTRIARYSFRHLH